MQIIATKLGEGRVMTKVDGSGKDLLEMLVAVNADVANVMIDHEITPPAILETLEEMANIGLQTAITERAGGSHEGAEK